LLLAACCHAAQFGSIPSDAAKVSPTEAQRFLDKICPGHNSAEGCTPCPTEMPQSPQTWTLRTFTFGHFLTQAGDDDFVSGTGCESHANLTSGSYLFTKERSSWRKVWYAAGQNADDCKELPASDGRDLLVCEDRDQHFGVADSFLYLLDAGQDPTKREDRTLDILDDSVGGCKQLPDGIVQSGAIESVSFPQATSPHAVRITVTARLGRAIPPKILNNFDQCMARSSQQSRPYSGATDSGNSTEPSQDTPPYFSQSTNSFRTSASPTLKVLC